MSTDIETATAFFCVTILVIFAYVLFATADMKSPEEKAWEKLNSIGTGVFEVGTVGGKYAYDDYNDNATKIEITVNEYENVVINILEGNYAGRTVTIGVNGWRITNSQGHMYFDVEGIFVELCVWNSVFGLF